MALVDARDVKYISRVLKKNKIRLCEKCDDFLNTKRKRFCAPCQLEEISALKQKGFGSSELAAHLGISENSFIAYQNKRRREAIQ